MVIAISLALIVEDFSYSMFGGVPNEKLYVTGFLLALVIPPLACRVFYIFKPLLGLDLSHEKAASEKHF